MAVWAASEEEPRLLILESTFSSLREVAAVLYPALPTGQFLGHTYDSTLLIGQIKCPVLVIHSRDDELIPIALSRKLYDSITGPKEFVEISGSHNAGYSQSLSVYVPAWEKFLAEYL